MGESLLIRKTLGGPSITNSYINVSGQTWEEFKYVSGTPTTRHDYNYFFLNTAHNQSKQVTFFANNPIISTSALGTTSGLRRITNMPINQNNNFSLTASNGTKYELLTNINSNATHFEWNWWTINNATTKPNIGINGVGFGPGTIMSATFEYTERTNMVTITEPNIQVSLPYGEFDNKIYWSTYFGPTDDRNRVIVFDKNTAQVLNNNLTIAGNSKLQVPNSYGEAFGLKKLNNNYYALITIRNDQATKVWHRLDPNNFNISLANSGGLRWPIGAMVLINGTLFTHNTNYQGVGRIEKRNPLTLAYISEHSAITDSMNLGSSAHFFTDPSETYFYYTVRGYNSEYKVLEYGASNMTLTKQWGSSQYNSYYESEPHQSADRSRINFIRDSYTDSYNKYLVTLTLPGLTAIVNSPVSAFTEGRINELYRFYMDEARNNMYFVGFNKADPSSNVWIYKLNGTDRSIISKTDLGNRAVFNNTYGNSPLTFNYTGPNSQKLLFANSLAGVNVSSNRFYTLNDEKSNVVYRNQITSKLP
jgi:hypothetical protein